MQAEVLLTPLRTLNAPKMQRGTFAGPLAVRSSKAPRCAPLRLSSLIAPSMPNSALLKTKGLVFSATPTLGSNSLLLQNFPSKSWSDYEQPWHSSKSRGRAELPWMTDSAGVYLSANIAFTCAVTVTVCGVNSAVAGAASAMATLPAVGRFGILIGRITGWLTSTEA
jgi:hypothetical protein